MAVEKPQEGKHLGASALTLCVSTFQLLLLVLDGLHLGLVDIGQGLPLSPVGVQAREHGVDLRVESGKLLQTQPRCDTGNNGRACRREADFKLLRWRTL